MIIDYDDMVANGIVKTASDFLADESIVKYAIYLETPSGTVGKFRITTLNDVKNSIEAINKNASLPDYIKDPAMRYIQKAANLHNVDTGWSKIPPCHSCYVKLAADEDEQPQTIHIFKCASCRDIPITSVSELRTAVDIFKSSSRTYSPADRFAAAAGLLKTAIALNAPCDRYVSAYAYAVYNPRTEQLLDMRKNLTDNPTAKEEYGLLKEAFHKLGDTLPPDTFLKAVEGIDKIAGIDRDVVQFFEA